MRNAEFGMRNAERGMDDLKLRTKQFALRIIHLVESLPPGRICDTIGKQLLRAGTSVGGQTIGQHVEPDPQQILFQRWE